MKRHCLAAVGLIFVSVLIGLVFARANTLTTTFAVTGVTNTSGRCAANGVPAAAQAAGFTTLAYCLDFSQSQYATLSNWFDASGTSGSTFSAYCSNNPHCDSSHIYQCSDPATGNTDMCFQWNQADCQQGNCYRIEWNTINSNGSAGYDFPAGHYTEIRWRLGTNLATTCSDPSPDWFWWSHDYVGAGNPLWEQDVVELYGGYSGCQPSAGMLNWQISCYQSYLTNYPDDRQRQHTYGMLTTMDGNSSARISAWYDNALHVQNYSNPDTGTNCGAYNGNSNYPNYNTQTNRMYLAFWHGGFGIDQDLSGPVILYVEYIAEWDCANWKTDNTCVGNGLKP